jgi:hypothetical protein
MVYQARLGTRQSDLSPLDRGGTAPSGTWACAQTSLIQHTKALQGDGILAFEWVEGKSSNHGQNKPDKQSALTVDQTDGV